MYRLKSERGGGSCGGVLNALGTGCFPTKVSFSLPHFRSYFSFVFFFSSLFLLCYAPNNAQCTRCYDAAIVYVILFARRLLHPQPRNTRRVRHVIFVPKTRDVVYNTTQCIYSITSFFLAADPTSCPPITMVLLCARSRGMYGGARENRGRHASERCAFCWQADNAQNAQHGDGPRGKYYVIRVHQPNQLLNDIILILRRGVRRNRGDRLTEVVFWRTIIQAQVRRVP